MTFTDGKLTKVMVLGMSSTYVMGTGTSRRTPGRLTNSDAAPLQTHHNVVAVNVTATDSDGKMLARTKVFGIIVDQAPMLSLTPTLRSPTISLSTAAPGADSGVGVANIPLEYLDESATEEDLFKEGWHTHFVDPEGVRLVYSARSDDQAVAVVRVVQSAVISGSNDTPATVVVTGRSPGTATITVTATETVDNLDTDTVVEALSLGQSVSDTFVVTVSS